MWQGFKVVLFTIAATAAALAGARAQEQPPVQQPLAKQPLAEQPLAERPGSDAAPAEAPPDPAPLPPVELAVPERSVPLTLVVEQAQRYRRCIERARLYPDTVLAEALEWRDAGGGLPARHCIAVALVTLEEYAEGAARFEQVAEDLRLGRDLPRTNEPLPRAVLLSELYSQAGNAWLLSDDPARAYNAFSQALAEAPDGGGIALEALIDRARASAASGDYAAALRDLDRAVLIDAGRVDLYVYRASAHRALDAYDAAQAEVDTALHLDPANPDALLEQGNLARLTGDDTTARQTWLTLLQRYPDTPAAQAAQTNLERMDVRGVDDGDGG